MTPSDDRAAAEYGPPIWPPFERLQSVLTSWAREHPDTMQVDVVGRSGQGRPVYAVRLTDPTAGDDDKEQKLKKLVNVFDHAISTMIG